MSSDKTVTRSRTWRFSHTLYTCVKPDAGRGLCPTSSIDPWDFIKRMLDDLFNDGPPAVAYIHLRVSRADYDRCVACGRSGTALPNLPFTGFMQAVAEWSWRTYPAPLGAGGVGSIPANPDALNVPSFRRRRFEMKLSPFMQAKSAVRQSLLQVWLDAVWTPVGSKLCSDPQYRREFMEPTDAAAFVYFLVRGKPALDKAGRKKKQPTALEVTFPQRPFGACNVKLPCWN